MSVKKLLILFFLIIAGMTLTGFTFVEPGNVSSFGTPGFFMGVWHGLVAPYTLIIRLFADIYMYAVPNNGLFYDTGFLLGIVFSLPIGWLAAIISTGFLLIG